jgi:glycosyltransferase involved in cell wall biosynthesis
MNEKHPYRTIIPPVPDGEPRPLWSVMIPTYNCARYLRETLASVLAQDIGSEFMQIEVIDDHSTKDDPEAVVKELGNGRVGFYRQSENVGHTKNFETCLKRARGRLIHLLHGDDYVRNGFYGKLQQAFDENPEIGAAFSRHIIMDEHGHWQAISPLEQTDSGLVRNWLEQIASRQRIQTPSIVVRREVYENFGAFDSRLSWAEDWEMWVRIAAYYPVWYEVEPLALYRMHSASNSGRYVRTGENVRDLRRAIGIFKQYLPNECADKLSKSALEFYAFEALNSARKLVAVGDTSAAMNQLREALLCRSSLKIIKSSLKLSLKIIMFSKLVKFAS